MKQDSGSSPTGGGLLPFFKGRKDAPTHKQGEMLSEKANLTWLTEQLAVGGDLSMVPEIAAEQVQDIIDQDIDLVIDVRAEATDQVIWKAVHMEYKWLPTEDHPEHHIPDELFEMALHHTRLHVDNFGKVLIHCHMGINRAPSVAFAVLLDQGMDPIKAYNLIREKRPTAFIAYAMDALRYDLRVNDREHPLITEAGLERHIKASWTKEQVASAQHAIRSGHERDYDERVLLAYRQRDEDNGA